MTAALFITLVIAQVSILAQIKEFGYPKINLIVFVVSTLTFVAMAISEIQGMQHEWKESREATDTEQPSTAGAYFSNGDSKPVLFRSGESYQF